VTAHGIGPVAEQVLRGGVNEVVRVGSTVRRPTGAWTPAVHALLRHLAAKGFAGAPRVHGFDERGREILDFMPGQVGDHPGTGRLGSTTTRPRTSPRPPGRPGTCPHANRPR
jgi:hypothetical protein